MYFANCPQNLFHTGKKEWVKLDVVADFKISSKKDEEIPLGETEIVLIRHGWPHQDKTVSAEEWVLDYTAYLELGRFLDAPALQGIETIYTSPLIKARQTAGFYFAQWQSCWGNEPHYLGSEWRPAVFQRHRPAKHFRLK